MTKMIRITEVTQSAIINQFSKKKIENYLIIL